ncbi:hypothetical protein MD484_g3946, partial [Candolleomyces efflorescens]
MILHPVFLDTTWLDSQFGDPRLYRNYNLIAFDMRTVGRSTCQPSGKHDSWVDAADLALCHQKLHLPPCHIFALEALAINCALRFAILFPEMCASLALCNVPSPLEQRWTYNTLEELVHSWCYSEDLESLEHAATELLHFLLGPDRDLDLQDQLVAHWEKVIPPKRRPWVIETLSVLINRIPLEPELYAQVKQPTLILHGERNEICPRKHSEALAAKLTGVENGAVIYTVRGAATFLSIIPGSASIANQTFTKFLQRLPAVKSEIVAPQMSISDRMKEALERQSALVGKKDITSLDPLCPLSFSCLTEEAAQKQAELIAEYSKGRFSAFDPLGPDGRPPRKVSQGKSEHWFQSGKDGLSVAATNFLPAERSGKQEPERPPRNNDRETQLVKPSSPAAALDKYIIKGPMAK